MIKIFLKSDKFSHKAGVTNTLARKSTIVSIPKDPKVSLSNSDNYRGISLFNCICNLLDNVILLLYKSQLSPSEMQFVLKKNILHHYVH